MRTLTYGLLLLAVAQAAVAQDFDPSQSTIQVANVSTTCDGETPVLKLTLDVNPADAGQPGLVYVGATDPGQTRATFYTRGGWQSFAGGMLPIYSIARNGLQSMPLAIPMDLSMALGTQLYVGYGVLTPQDEAMVEQIIASVAQVKAQFPNRPVPTIAPDHYRQTLIQKNMKKYYQYRHVRDWTADLYNLCDRETRYTR